MELTFLGTSSGSPTRRRNVAGCALRIDGDWDLFDCGEGTQFQVVSTPLSLPKLRRIFISHLHGDHCFGIFGVLSSRAMDEPDRPLTIIGPIGIRRMVDTVLELSSSHLPYPIEFREVPPKGGCVVDDDEMIIDAVPVSHRVTSFAWWMQEADRPGHLDVDAATTAGVPRGPLLGALQAGESIELDDGRRVEPAEVIGPPIPGRRLVISGDNSEPRSLLTRTGPLDVLVHEATYTEPVLAGLSSDHGHSTAARVASAAHDAGVRNLILTHFSPRFEKADGGPGIEVVRDEARSHFAGGLHLASDLDRVEISHDGSTITVL